MKQNKKTQLNFVTSFKYWIIFPIVVAVLAIILGSIFNLNLDYDFKTVDTFNVQFNTTITDTEYETLENNIAEMLNNHKVEDYRLDRIGEGAENGVIVQIVSNKSIDIDEIKLDLEANLKTNVQAELTSDIIISTTDTISNEPRNVLSMTLFASLSIALIILLGFIYNLVRYNLVAGYSLVLTMLFEIAMLFGLQVVTRIPFNANFMIAYVLMVLTTVILTTCINNFIKTDLSDDKYAKSTNADRVIRAVKSIYIGVIIAFALAIIAFMIVGFMGSLSTLYTMISIVLSLFISILSSMFFYTTIWTFFYQKDKDNTLKRRLELNKKKLEDKEKKIKIDEKIVV